MVASTTMQGRPVASPAARRPAAPRRAMQTQALFGRKAAVVVEKAPEPKKGLFSFASKPKAEPVAKTKGGKAAAKKGVDKAEEYESRMGAVARFTSALDFAEVRSKSDAQLLYDAKYKRSKDGKMTPEQAAALRRKVGGTAKDYWKEWVEVKGQYTEKGYVGESDGVTALPFLLAVVGGMVVALAYVVSQTS